MSIAALNIKVVAKRMLSRREASLYCGRTLREFDSECPVQPITFANGDQLYDTRDLDRWLDTLKVEDQDSADIIKRLGRS